LQAEKNFVPELVQELFNVWNFGAHSASTRQAKAAIGVCVSST